jgi:hypothetical protein
MLTIRTEQLQGLERAMRQRFVNEMRRELDNAFPQSGTSEEAKLGLIDEGIARAETFGIVRRLEVKRYLHYVLAHGIQFGTEPDSAWAGDILRDPRFTGAQKLDRVDDAALVRACQAQRD